MLTSEQPRSAAPGKWSRALHRLAAVVTISLVAASGGLLAELNNQARAEARVSAFDGRAPATAG